MVDTEIAQERAKLAAQNAEKARRQSILYGQLNSSMAHVNTLNSKKIELENKIQRLTTALKNIENPKNDFTTGKSNLAGIQIESSSWKGKNATKADQLLEQMKTSAQSIDEKITSSIETIQNDKTTLENELQQVESDITSTNNQINSILS